MVVGRIVARVGRSRLVVGHCSACSMRSGVALALEILFFEPLSIAMKPEIPQANKTRACRLHTPPRSGTTSSSGPQPAATSRSAKSNCMQGRLHRRPTGLEQILT